MTYQQEIIRLLEMFPDCTSAYIPFMTQFVDGSAPRAFSGVRSDGLEKMGTGLANTTFALATLPAPSTCGRIEPARAARGGTAMGKGFRRGGGVGQIGSQATGTRATSRGCGGPGGRLPGVLHFS